MSDRDTPRIRSAGPGDAGALARVQASAGLPGEPEAELAAGWAQMLRRPAFYGNLCVSVCELGDHVVGFGAGATQRAPWLRSLGYQGEVTTLWIAPSDRGRGLGRQVLGAVLSGLAARGHRGASIWLARTNDEGRRFALAAGAAPVIRAGDGPKGAGGDGPRAHVLGWTAIGTPDRLGWSDPRRPAQVLPSETGPAASEPGQAPGHAVVGMTMGHQIETAMTDAQGTAGRAL
ncbi:GNAT family N-acetyltransferase [Mesobaculum littorinae]|nr:GNAT family N-acetyltransferase [Mesobaculum littorinae]